ncbi:hypothetical protein ACOI9X_12595 [Pseudomonas sp. P2757]|uniref:hypothetical protein n=1 Tax=unclassified Pseudomonas TaxID=196821 RepID=UPI003B5AFD36
MSLTVGFPHPNTITIGGKTPAAIDALNEAAAKESDQLLGKEEVKTNQVRTGGPAQEEPQVESGGNQSITVKMLLKRMQELQKQLQEQQQQLAAAQAASYPTPEAKATRVMAIQGQIAATSGALAQVAASLVKELTKSAGGVINTTA